MFSVLSHHIQYTLHITVSGAQASLSLFTAEFFDLDERTASRPHKSEHQNTVGPANPKRKKQHIVESPNKRVTYAPDFGRSLTKSKIERKPNGKQNKLFVK